MEDLSGAAFQRATHQQHLTGGVHAGEQVAVPQALPEDLFAYRQPSLPAIC